LGVTIHQFPGVLPRRRIGRIVGDVLRELIEHREHRSLGFTVPNGARHHELGPKRPSRRLVRLRRDEDQEALGVGQQPAPQLADDALGRRYLGDLVQLVQQHASGFHPGQHRGVERLDLQRRLGPPVRDLAQVLLHVQALPEKLVRILVDHAQRLAKGDVRQRHRGRDQQEFRPRPLVHQQRRHHQRRGVGRLRTLLRRQQEDLADHPLPSDRIERAMQGAHDLAEPVRPRFGQRRRADHIWQPQLVEDRDRPVSLATIEVRQIGQ